MARNRFVKGDETFEDGADYMAYGIDDLSDGHGNKVEVYKDEELRDLIIDLLNQHFGRGKK